MMRRELLIILGVLVPFGALVVLGLLFLRQEPPPPVIVAPPEPEVVVAPVAPSPPPVAVVVDAGAAQASTAPVPKELAAPLAAVTPEVMLCFRDERAHLKTPQRLEVRFTPTADGGFVEVHVPALTNPLIAACVEDVFDEVRFAPTGAETFRPAIHTFIFDPSRD
ncbi:MAG: hypothetical protein GQE15_18585 [Archangiaceae bacterium]|nr:hypothetical protein [Archangiaceae bacterium]